MNENRYRNSSELEIAPLQSQLRSQLTRHEHRGACRTLNLIGRRSTERLRRASLSLRRTIASELLAEIEISNSILKDCGLGLDRLEVAPFRLYEVLLTRISGKPVAAQHLANALIDDLAHGGPHDDVRRNQDISDCVTVAQCAKAWSWADTGEPGTVICELKELLAGNHDKPIAAFVAGQYRRALLWIGETAAATWLPNQGSEITSSLDETLVQDGSLWLPPSRRPSWIPLGKRWSHLYFYSLEQITNNEARNLIDQAVALTGGLTTGLALLGWNRASANKLVKSQVLIDPDGNGLASLRLRDVERMKLGEVEEIIQNQVVMQVERLGSGRDLATFFATSDRTIRRIKHRIKDSKVQDAGDEQPRSSPVPDE